MDRCKTKEIVQRHMKNLNAPLQLSIACRRRPLSQPAASSTLARNRQARRLKAMLLQKMLISRQTRSNLARILAACWIVFGDCKVESGDQFGEMRTDERHRLSGTVIERFVIRNHKQTWLRE